jgi:thioredoxin-dependent peroxiredoxin
MKNRLVGTAALGALMALLPAMPAPAALKPGAKAPLFTAEASLAGKDSTFSLKAALKKGPVVLYFYPCAFTRGCDLEAHTFAADKAAFDAAGATVLGVSADGIRRLNAFSSDPKYCAGKFPVASDAGGKIADRYGLRMMPARRGMADVRGVKIGHGFIPRTTFVIAGDGRVAAVFSTKADHLGPAEHVKKSLAEVRDLRKEQARP